MDIHDTLFVDQDWLDHHSGHTHASDYELFDLTDKGKMFLVIFQTFAFMQIFNILNARRPSYRDLNPFRGISLLTLVALILLVGFQFALCYVPIMFGYTTVDLYTNLACMCLGAGTVIWFASFKALIQFFNGPNIMSNQE